MMNLKILQVGNTDRFGMMFNGHVLHQKLNQRGIPSKNLVWRKESNDPETYEIFPYPKRYLVRGFQILENLLSVQSLLYPFSLRLLWDPNFLWANVVHYHLIHASSFSLFLLPFLTHKKPSVWTLHDPWALTGHCTTPYQCPKWETGCGRCPNLHDHFSMNHDHTAFMWNIKKRLYRASKIDLVVASKWMRRFVEKSPLTENFRVHQIPFGLDLNLFKPGDARKCREMLGIPAGHFVICFRASSLECKGLRFIKESLKSLTFPGPVTLLTFDEIGHLEEFRGTFHLHELGWVRDPEKMVLAYSASDVFLMPSLSESFGMMAAEAMSCGVPVVTFEGTAVPEVIFSPQGGIAVKSKDSVNLGRVIRDLYLHPEALEKMSQKALELAQRHYNIEDHVNRLIALYSEVEQRFKSTSVKKA